MGDAQIEELGRTRREIFDINLTAPVDGKILERRIAVGQRFLKGETALPDRQSRTGLGTGRHPTRRCVFVRAILRKRASPVRGLPPLPAKVATALPQFDEQGRTGRLRLEVDNPRGTLVPGMIVNVDIDVPARPAITVHADAVIDSGTTKCVFVALGDGRYEAREVETGWQDARPRGDPWRPAGGRTRGHCRRVPARFGKPHERPVERMRMKCRRRWLEGHDTNLSELNRIPP